MKRQLPKPTPFGVSSRRPHRVSPKAAFSSSRLPPNRVSAVLEKVVRGSKQLSKLLGQPLKRRLSPKAETIFEPNLLNRLLNYSEEEEKEDSREFESSAHSRARQPLRRPNVPTLQRLNFPSSQPLNFSTSRRQNYSNSRRLNFPSQRIDVSRSQRVNLPPRNIRPASQREILRSSQPLANSNSQRPRVANAGHSNRPSFPNLYTTFHRSFSRTSQPRNLSTSLRLPPTLPLSLDGPYWAPGPEPNFSSMDEFENRQTPVSRRRLALGPLFPPSAN